jgi:hypothetical protein
MTRRTLLVRPVVLAALSACLSLSAAADAQTLSGVTTRVVQPVSRKLSPATRTALKAKMAARVNPPQQTTSAYLKFAPTADNGGLPFGPVACNVGTWGFYVHVVNAGNAPASAQAAVHLEAIGPNGELLAFKTTSSSTHLSVQGTAAGADRKLTFTPSLQALPSPRAAPFNQQPAFLAWIEGDPNDGNVVTFEPDFSATISTTNVPASSGAMLAFVADGTNSSLNTTAGALPVVRSCFKVKNFGAAASPAAKIRIALRTNSTGTNGSDVAAVMANLPAVAPGAQAEVCSDLPAAPDVSNWGYYQCEAAQQKKYGYEAVIVGAPSNGATVTIPAFAWTYRVGAL